MLAFGHPAFECVVGRHSFKREIGSTKTPFARVIHSNLKTPQLERCFVVVPTGAPEIGCFTTREVPA